MKQIKIWFITIRPITLLASISPVLVGSSLAYYYLHVQGNILILLLITSALIQVFTNLVNDYYDFINNIDGEDRLGPKRGLQLGQISLTEMSRAIYIVLFLIIFLGALIVFKTDIYILIIGLFSLLFAYLYTAPFFSLSRRGLADIFVFIFFGPVAVLGTYYAHTQLIPTLYPILVSSLPGSLSVTILMINNIRDYETDTKAGKKTLVVKLGVSKVKLIYVCMFIPCFVIPILLFSILGFWAYLPLATIPIIYFSVKNTCGEKKNSVSFNYILASNAVLLFSYCCLLSLGFILPVLF